MSLFIPPLYHKQPPDCVGGCGLRVATVTVVPQGYVDGDAVHDCFVDGKEVAFSILAFLDELLVGDFHGERTALAVTHGREGEHLDHLHVARHRHVEHGEDVVHIEAEEDTIFHRLAEFKGLHLRAGNGRGHNEHE